MVSLYLFKVCLCFLLPNKPCLSELIGPVLISSRLQTDVELMWWLELTKTSTLVDTGSPFNTRARVDLRVAKDKDVPTVTSYD